GRPRALVLVARREDRLRELQTELTGHRPDLPVSIECCNLADRVQVAALVERLEAAHGGIDVLINNAGHGVSGLYDQAPWEAVENMLELNVLTLAYLTRRLVPGMVARGRGGVLNVSSGYGVTFGPGMAGYIGSKHFVTGFTEGLRVDLSGTGVTVTQVLPGPVETEFSAAMAKVSHTNQRMRLPKLLTLSADRCARAALNAFVRGRARVVPGFFMKLVLALARFSPLACVRAPMSRKARWYRRQVAP
ncbi:MAG: SDR family NAD(P)-dependent oxidoreductase, partial [Planctomycetota bacterium]